MNGHGKLDISPQKDLLQERLTKPLDYGLKKIRWQRVYCQSCNKDLTDVGGVVSTSGRVYCDTLGLNGSNFCLDKEIIPMVKGYAPKRAIGFHNSTPERMQERIKENLLTHFGPLESKVRVPD